MLLAILNVCSKEELEEAGNTQLPDDMLDSRILSFLKKLADDKKMVVLNKIRAVGRMAKMFSSLRYVRV